MKVLYATHLLQGFRRGDYTFCKAGELVHLDFDACGRDCAETTGELCPACRVFCGLESLKATTTALVRETRMTERQLRRAMHKSFRKSRFGLVYAEPAIQLIVAVAAVFPDGAIIQRGPTQITMRGYAVNPELGDDSEAVFGFPDSHR